MNRILLVFSFLCIAHSGFATEPKDNHEDAEVSALIQKLRTKLENKPVDFPELFAITQIDIFPALGWGNEHSVNESVHVMAFVRALQDLNNVTEQLKLRGRLNDKEQFLWYLYAIRALNDLSILEKGFSPARNKPLLDDEDRISILVDKIPAFGRPDTPVAHLLKSRLLRLLKNRPGSDAAKIQEELKAREGFTVDDMVVLMAAIGDRNKIIAPRPEEMIILSQAMPEFLTLQEKALQKKSADLSKTVNKSGHPALVQTLQRLKTEIEDVQNLRASFKSLVEPEIKIFIIPPQPGSGIPKNILPQRKKQIPANPKNLIDVERTSILG